MPMLLNRRRARKLALAAATLTITAAPDPVAGIPTQLGARGVASDDSQYVTERYKPMGEAGCAATPEADDARGSVPLDRFWLPVGAFSVQGNVTFDQAGEHRVCAWLRRFLWGDAKSNPVLAARSRIIAVRPPQLTLTLAASPTTLVSGQAVTVTTTTLAEVERALFVYGMPDTGRGCAANADAAEKTDGAFAIVSRRLVLGGPLSTTTDVTLERLGTRLLCGYLQREYLSDPAEAVAQATVTVLAPPEPCVVPAVVAGEPLAAASARVRGASCVVGQVRYEASARFARGSVFKVAPVAGTRLDPGAAVDLWVSAGAPCVVPAVPASRTLAAVRRRLVAAGCSAGRITHRPSRAIRRGRVIALGTPRATKLPPRARVAIVVSRGPA